MSLDSNSVRLHRPLHLSFSGTDSGVPFMCQKLRRAKLPPPAADAHPRALPPTRCASQRRRNRALETTTPVTVHTCFIAMHDPDDLAARLFTPPSLAGANPNRVVNPIAANRQRIREFARQLRDLEPTESAGHRGRELSEPIGARPTLENQPENNERRRLSPSALCVNLLVGGDSAV